MKSNLVRTGEWIYRKSKDPNFDLEIIPITVKRKLIKVLKFARVGHRKQSKKN